MPALAELLVCFLWEIELILGGGLYVHSHDFSAMLHAHQRVCVTQRREKYQFVSPFLVTCVRNKILEKKYADFCYLNIRFK